MSGCVVGKVYILVVVYTYSTLYIYICLVPPFPYFPSTPSNKRHRIIIFFSTFLWRWHSFSFSFVWAEKKGVLAGRDRKKRDRQQNRRGVMTRTDDDAMVARNALWRTNVGVRRHLARWQERRSTVRAQPNDRPIWSSDRKFIRSVARRGRTRRWRGEQNS